MKSRPPRRPEVEKKEEETPGEEEGERRPAPWPKAAAARTALSKKEERSPSRPAIEFLEVRGEGRPRETPKQEPSSSSAGPGTLLQRSAYRFKTPPASPQIPRPSSSVGQDVRATKAQPLEEPSRPMLKATSKARPSSAVRPTTKGRSTDLTKEELSALRTEQIDSLIDDVPWSERGPTDDDVDNWRGQPWRHGHMGGKSGYRKRAGKFAEHYAKLAREGRLMPTRHGAVVVGKGKASETKRGMHERNKTAKGSKGKGKR